MGAITNPIILDASFEEQLDALNDLIRRQNAAINLLASNKRAGLATDISTVALLCKKGEITEIMGYGDKISPVWSDGSTEYTAYMNLCHEDDVEINDGENIHGAYFEWDKTLPFGVMFDAKEAFYYFDGTEGAGDHYITITHKVGNYWTVGINIQFTLSVAPANGDQLVINCDDGSSPANGKTWNLYAKGSTVSKDTGTTSEGTSGTQIGTTNEENNGATNGKVNAPLRILYGYGRWSQSALRQYLNSDGAAGTWWTPQNPWDRPTPEVETHPGFLSGYSENVKKYFKPTKVVTLACDVDDNVEDITYDKIFIASREQLYCAPENGEAPFDGTEGTYWEYYKNKSGMATPVPRYGVYEFRKKYPINDPTVAKKYYIRSAYAPRAQATFIGMENGNFGVAQAYTSDYRCTPCVFISK